MDGLQIDIVETGLSGRPIRGHAGGFQTVVKVPRMVKVIRVFSGSLEALMWGDQPEVPGLVSYMFRQLLSMSISDQAEVVKRTFRNGCESKAKEISHANSHGPQSESQAKAG